MVDRYKELIDKGIIRKDYPTEPTIGDTNSYVGEIFGKGRQPVPSSNANYLKKLDYAKPYTYGSKEQYNSENRQDMDKFFGTSRIDKMGPIEKQAILDRSEYYNQINGPDGNRTGISRPTIKEPEKSKGQNMTLEELFATKKGPKNYVEFPPVEPTPNYVESRKPETNKLQKFLSEQSLGVSKDKPRDIMPPDGSLDSGPNLAPKEVVKSLNPETEKAIQEATPQSQERVEQLKNIFNMEQPPTEIPQEQPVQAQPTQAPPVESDPIGRKSYEELIAEMRPQASTTDALLGLIPLALDTLSGGRGHALDVSGKYYLDRAGSMEKRNQTLDDKLLDMQKSRSIASAKKGSMGAKRYQSVDITDPNTLQAIKAIFDTHTGEYTDSNGRPLNSEKIRTAYSVIPEEATRRSEMRVKAGQELQDSAPRILPESGELGRIVGGKTSQIPSGIQSTMNKKQEKDLESITSKYLISDSYKVPAKALSSSSNVTALLNEASSGNPVAANIARGQLVKLSGDVGAFSDSDIERVGGSPSIKNKVKRFAHLQKTGLPFMEEDVKAMREIARVLSSIAKLKIQESSSELERDFVKNYGGIKGAVGTKLAPFIPSDTQNKAKPKPSQLSYEEWKKLKYGK